MRLRRAQPRPGLCAQGSTVRATASRWRRCQNSGPQNLRVTNPASHENRMQGLQAKEYSKLQSQGGERHIPPSPGRMYLSASKRLSMQAVTTFTLGYLGATHIRVRAQPGQRDHLCFALAPKAPEATAFTYVSARAWRPSGQDTMQVKTMSASLTPWRRRHCLHTQGVFGGGGRRRQASGQKQRNRMSRRRAEVLWRQMRAASRR